MSDLNKEFPEILLAYVADVGCEFSNARLNELSKFVSQLEARADLHANLNRGVEKALGLEPNADWSELPNQVGDLKERFEACESALLSMVYQYLYRPLDPRTNEPANNLYQHDFMSAGEEACYYLVTNGLAEWVDDDSWAIRMKESEAE